MAIPRAQVYVPVSEGLVLSLSLSRDNVSAALKWAVICSTALLMKIAKMWITVRGFSYASAWVQKMKVTQQQSHTKICHLSVIILSCL